MPKLIKILGMDPSFSNWGLVQAIFNPSTGKLVVTSLSVTSPVVSKSKQTRQNSLDLTRAKQLAHPLIPLFKWADIVTVEVPHGSQSARAMASYGVCLGILGTLALSPVPIIQVNANETRHVITGKKEASKAEGISWGTTKHPEAPWPMLKRNGEKIINAGKAEHMADALASIYAAMETETFKTMAMLASKE